MPNVPQQVIERDVSVFLVAEDSFDVKYAKAIRENILNECNNVRAWAMNQYGRGAGDSRSSSALNQGIQREITNYLLSLNNPIALKILEEYKVQWKNGKY